MPGAVSAALLFFTSVGFSGAALTVATYVGAALITAAPFALSAAIGLLNAPQQPAIKPSQGQQMVRQSLAGRRRSYGTVRVSGTLFFIDTVTDVLYMGLAINHGRISEFVSFHIDEREVTVDPSTSEVTTSPYNIEGAWIYSRLGVAAETAYSPLSAQFGISDVRGDGVASILGLFDNAEDGSIQMQRYPNGLPELRVTINATVCFDPRNLVHDLEDETTWEFSENPVVVVLNYLIDPDGYGMPWSRIEPNLAEWIAAMDICDEAIEVVGATPILYRLAGTFELTERPRDVVARMLSTCDGRLWQRRNGSIGISVGRFVSPSITIAAKDIISVRMEHGQDNLTAIAGIRAEYMSPSRDYREHEADPWPDGATVVALEDERVDSLDLSWVPDGGQARRLMKRQYKRQTAAWRGTIVTFLPGLRAMDERYINVEIDEFNISESFEIEDFQFDPTTMRCKIDIRSIDASIDEWDAVTEEGEEVSGEAFGFDTFASVSGIASINPISAGGEEGQCAVIFACGDSLASTPAGWALLNSVGPISGLAMGVFAKVLDGTESAVTFLGSASGVLIMGLFDGVIVPTASQLGQQITTAIPSDQILAAGELPYAAIAFGAANKNIPDNFQYDFDVENKIRTRVNDDIDFGGYVQLGVLTLPDAVTAEWFYDSGTNGLMTFVLKPNT